MASAASCHRNALPTRGVGAVADRWRIRCLPAAWIRSSELEVPRRDLTVCCGSGKGSVEEFPGAENERFVGWFREAWPYIRGHRESTIVVVISGEIVASPYLDDVLQDISLLHGMGIKIVLIPGTHVTIDELLEERGKQGRYAGCYRVTDSESLEAAMEAAGRIRLAMEAKLSPGPPILSLRRHGDHNRWHELGVFVASGNFLAAKRRGVVDGIDFGFTGEVKKIDVPRIRERLERDNLVIVSNLGYSSTGEVLNCNTYEVATACALALEANKLICIGYGQAHNENGIPSGCISLHDADLIIRKQADKCETAANYVKVVDLQNQICPCNFMSNGKRKTSMAVKQLSQRNDAKFQNGVGYDRGNGIWSSGQGFAIGGEERLSRKNLSELAVAAFACKRGVQRVHIIDGTLNGAILLELFTRHGIGTMVASDVHEGTRMARHNDLQGIRKVIHPLEESGALITRSQEQLRKELDSFIVVEREGSIIACAALSLFLKEKCGEVAAFAVSPECRGHGEGDKLLDYVEKKAISLGLERLFLLTTRAVDWFMRRGFLECCIESIPEERRKRIDFSRGSKYYTKKLQAEPGGITIDTRLAFRR